MVEQWPPKPPVGGSNPSALVLGNGKKNSLMGQDQRKNFLKRVSLAKKQAAFAGNFIEEIKKIEWVTKRDLKRYVKIALMSIFGFGFSIYCVDLALRECLSLLGKVTSFFFG